jgi:hypothetical protein
VDSRATTIRPAMTVSVQSGLFNNLSIYLLGVIRGLAP